MSNTVPVIYHFIIALLLINHPLLDMNILMYSFYIKNEFLYFLSNSWQTTMFVLAYLTMYMKIFKLPKAILIDHRSDNVVIHYQQKKENKLTNS